MILEVLTPLILDPSGHLSGSGSSPSSDSEDSTDFSPVKIAENDLGLSPARLLPGFAASIKKRKQFLASMSPPREFFSQFPTLAPLRNAGPEEHEENAQDEDEDNGPFASEALSDFEEDKSSEQVLVTGRRFKETLREEKPPRVQVGSSRKRRPGEVDSAEAVEALKLHRKQLAEERAAAGRRYQTGYTNTLLPFFDDEQKDWWNHWFVQQEEIGRNISNNRRERLVGDMCWFWPVPPERDEHVVDEPVAVTTAEEFRRRIFSQRRPIYSGPRRPPPGSATLDRVAHIGHSGEVIPGSRRLRKVTEKQIRTGLFRIARDKEASQPEVSNKLPQDVDSADDEETECSGPDLEEEEE
ncbi:hypothetical protein R1sor_000393 [Riccia sorocarpa]|uniref:Uncharacterized protein n=1 Tax=Riccia sorocarpa TaxID=122646 RepID=A0ABD3GUP2_9MARC